MKPSLFISSNFRFKPLALSVAAVTSIFTLGASTAFAQGDKKLEEITVTGSRIQQTSGMTTPVPVTSVTTDELRDYDPGSTISQQLDALPQFFNNGSPQRGDGGNPAVGSGGPGALNIRNLNSATTGAGISRTLTLLDGARVVPTDKRGTVNVDVFPTALMKSVDVVTGGASAAYGADALGGVVNFVLDRQFEGVKINVGTGMEAYDNAGKQWEFSVAAGKGFGRLHLIGSLEAKHVDQVRADRYRWDQSEQQWGYVTNPAWSKGAPAGVPQRLSVTNVATVNNSPTGLFRGTGTSLDWYQFTKDGKGIVPFVLPELVALPGQSGGTATLSGGPEAETNFLTSSGGPTGMEAVTRNGFGAAQFEFSSTFSGYVQAMVGRTESNNFADNANFNLSDNWAPRIAIDNAYLPDAVRQVMLANNLTEIPVNKASQQFDGSPELGSDREGRNVFTQWQWSLGVDWAFAEGWNMKASYQQGQSKRNSQAINLFQVDRAFLGMDAVVDPASGNIVCRVSLYKPTLDQLAATVVGKISSRPLSPYIPAGLAGNTQPLPYPVEPKAIDDCVPYNVLGSGNMSQAAIDYVGTDKTNLGYVDQDFAEVLVTGNLFEDWAGPVGFAGGVTWRDQQFISGSFPIDIDLLGPPLNEAALGIRGIPPGFSGGSGNLNLFSTVPYIGGQTDVYEWYGEVNVPLWESDSGQRAGTDLAFRRSTYDRSGAVDSWKAGFDVDVTSELRLRLTKSRDVREPSFSELFDAQGSGGNINDPDFNGETYLITSVRGGNPDLRPEVADTKTAGFVYQPTFMPWLNGLSLSLDWYDVKIKDAVAQLGGQRIVDDCSTGSASLCSLIDRDPGTGRVVNIYDVFLNVAAARARGVDAEVTWRSEPDFLASQTESFSMRWLTGYTMERSNTSLGGTPQDIAGSIGMPSLTSNITANYGVGAYSFQMQARYVDSVLRNATWVEGIDVDDNTIASMTWFNARLGYDGEFSNGAIWKLALNVQNIFDREPPIFGGANNTYDQYGRRYDVSFSYSF